MNQERANLIVVTAPSGAGKTTLLKRLISDVPNLAFSVSHTTRPPREGETDGVDYFFTTPESFLEYRDQDGFLEWAEVHGNYYGTSVKAVQERMQAGCDAILDIDVAGADQVRQKWPDAISIFIMPPSLESLRTRLTGRNKDTAEVIERRLRNALYEVQNVYQFTYVIINDDLEECYQQLKQIVLVQRLRTDNRKKGIRKLLKEKFSTLN